ncbi:MAG: redoxin domain-containing protein [Bacteroidota bacterium]
MRLLLLFCLFAFGSPSLQSQIGYQLGDSIAAFSLPSINGLDWQFTDTQKGFILVFISPSCPIVHMYSSRLQSLHDQYAPQGFPLVAVNSNHPLLSPQDSLPQLKAYAAQHAFSFPYLWDQDQSLARAFGASRTPQCFLVALEGKGSLHLRYIGAIDDNPRDASAVANKYLAKALEQQLQNLNPKQAYTRAAGCSIRWAQ